MRQITYWQAQDGMNFPSKRKCLEHEAECRIRKIVEGKMIRDMSTDDIMDFLKVHMMDLFTQFREILIEIPAKTQGETDD